MKQQMHCGEEGTRDATAVRTQLIQMACAATWGHGDIFPILLLRVMSGSMVLLMTESMLMSMAYVTTEGSLCGLCCCVKPCWCVWAILPLGDHADVWDLYYQPRPCSGPGLSCHQGLSMMVSMLRHRDMLISMICSATRDHAEICGMCWCWRSWS